MNKLWIIIKIKIKINKQFKTVINKYNKYNKLNKYNKQNKLTNKQLYKYQIVIFKINRGQIIKKTHKKLPKINKYMLNIDLVFWMLRN